MKPTVVFLHGLARTHRSMSALRAHVEREGYQTWAKSYPSRRMPIGELATLVAYSIRQDIPEGPIIGVTHSLGGIIARHMSELLRWDGLVMLAPPNAGSEVARRLSALPWFRWFFGPAAQGLASPEDWPAPPAPFAVIAGTRGATLANPPSWLVSRMKILPTSGAHDGTVAVAETRLPGMADFAEVDASHTWLMNHPKTRELVTQFLERRHFGIGERDDVE